MRAQAETWAGAGVNEDAVFLGVSSGVLADGATGLGEASVAGWGSAAAWFSHRLSRGVVGAIEGADLHPADALASAVASIREEYRGLGGDPEDGPSGSICVFRIDGDSLDLCLLGDCTSVVVERSGTAHVLRDEAVPRMDGEVVAQMVRLAGERGVPVSEAAESVSHLLTANRARRNTPDGYWIADLSGAGVPHARSHRFAWSAVSHLLFVTDGLAAAVDPLRLIDDYPALASEVRAGRAHDLIQRIREREGGDADLTKYPRLKVSDDAGYLSVWHAHEH